MGMYGVLTFMDRSTTVISITATPATRKWDHATNTQTWLTTVRVTVTVNPSGRLYHHTLMTHTIEVPPSQRNWSALTRVKHALRSSPELRKAVTALLTKLEGYITAITTRFPLTWSR